METTENYRIRLTPSQFDTVVAALRLLAFEMYEGRITPNDGDIGSILTCSGARPGGGASPIWELYDRLLTPATSAPKVGHA